MDVNQTYCDDHFAIDTYFKPLCRIPEIHTFFVNYISIKTKSSRGRDPANPACITQDMQADGDYS